MNTCGNCRDVLITGRKGNAFAGCKKTEMVVPHGWDGETNLFTFWRVPLSCPRLDTVKSESRASKKDWVVKSYDELKAEIVKA